jgi:tetratricopeptide (TPR) repeat protein
MRARVDGPFHVTGEDGSIVTPKGMKERALLALLLLSPGQRRTRAWLQAKLWSDRSAAQASGSCRQALSNLRKALGPARTRLISDRTTVWIAPAAVVEDRGEGELLDDLDVRDPEFDDWLREQRQARSGDAAGRTAPVGQARAGGILRHAPAPSRAVVAILPPRGIGARAEFLVRVLCQRIGGELVLLRGFDVVQADACDPALLGADPAVLVDVEALAEGAADYAIVQVLGAPSRRLGWSGRLMMQGPVGDIWMSDAATRIVNRTVQAVVDLAAPNPVLQPFIAVNRAVQRIYEFDRGRLARADEMLKGAATGDMRGLALAWRAFARLTSALEFRDTSSANARDAEAFAEEALAEMGDHPVVLALAAQVRMKVSDDVDAAHYLALRAVEIADQNPYALEALSQSLILQRRFPEADALAIRARRAAEGLPHSFNWDMQACLSALSMGRLEAALDAARECHRKMPFYRPALRYLAALSYLLDRREDALTFAGRLRRLEPDFDPPLLTAPGYPLDTLRALGLGEALRDRIG